MAIYSGFSHEKWWFSIAMLVYQTVRVRNQTRPRNLVFTTKDMCLLLYFCWNLLLEPKFGKTFCDGYISWYIQLIYHGTHGCRSQHKSSLCSRPWRHPINWFGGYIWSFMAIMATINYWSLREARSEWSLPHTFHWPTVVPNFHPNLTTQFSPSLAMSFRLAIKHGLG